MFRSRTSHNQKIESQAEPCLCQIKVGVTADAWHVLENHLHCIKLEQSGVACVHDVFHKSLVFPYLRKTVPH